MDHLVVLFDANMTAYTKRGFLETHILDLVDATISCLSAHERSSPYAVWNIYSFSTNILQPCASYSIINEQLSKELRTPEENRQKLASTLQYCPTSKSPVGLALLSAIAVISRVQNIVNVLSESNGIDLLYQGHILIIIASDVLDSETVNSALFSVKRYNVKTDIMCLASSSSANDFMKQVAYLTASKYSEVPKPQSSINNVSYFISQIFKATPSNEWRSLQLGDSVTADYSEKRLEFLGECHVCHDTINHGIACAMCFNLQCDKCFSGTCPTCCKL